MDAAGERRRRGAQPLRRRQRRPQRRVRRRRHARERRDGEQPAKGRQARHPGQPRGGAEAAAGLPRARGRPGRGHQGAEAAQRQPQQRDVQHPRAVQPSDAARIPQLVHGPPLAGRCRVCAQVPARLCQRAAAGAEHHAGRQQHVARRGPRRAQPAAHGQQPRGLEGGHERHVAQRSRTQSAPGAHRRHRGRQHGRVRAVGAQRVPPGRHRDQQRRAGHLHELGARATTRSSTSPSKAPPRSTTAS